MKRVVLFLYLLSIIHFSFSQSYPIFGKEFKVTIVGDTVPDAMEPFISPDGNTLFFNSLNNGINTSIYYSTKVNDSTFMFKGLLPGGSFTTPPHLDAVASIDSANRFFWVSTHDYPSSFHNLYHGIFTGTSVIDTARVYGTCYIYSPGWLIMDAAINYNGSLLYYANAFFDTCGSIPCKSKIEIAQKINDSTYNKLSNSDSLLKNVNDTAVYLTYAENVTKDGLELYYTRANPKTLTTELCVAVRKTPTDTFSKPEVIYTNPGYVIEAPTLTTDKSILYYHKKETTNYKLYMRYRTGTSGMQQLTIDKAQLNVYPNPATSIVNIDIPSANAQSEIKLYDMVGQLKLDEKNVRQIDVSQFPSGIYILFIKSENGTFINKITKL